MRKKVEIFKPVIFVLVISMFMITAFIGFVNYKLFTYIAPATAAVFVYTFFKYKFVRDDIDKFVQDIGTAVSQIHETNMISFPIPIIIYRDNGEIVWLNNAFSELYEDSNQLYGKNITEFIDGFDYTSLTEDKPVSVVMFDKDYSAYVVKEEQGDEKLFCVYFVEDTELKTYYREYFRTKSTVMIAVIDNYDELVQNAKDGELTQTVSTIEYEISQFAKEYEALICKTERDKYTIVMREEELKKAIDNKFSILDTIRNITVNERMSATLSIGVARDGKDIRDVEQNARQALDMALGRGGDQAALKTQNGYDFYGGISKGVEKRTKVKSRIVATALVELMTSCENIIIMGHRFADLDCFGAAVGLSKIASQMGKTVNIAIRSQKHLVSPLYEQLYENGYDKIFAEPEALLDTVNANTLLIIVDTHVENIVECPELYRSCKHVVVIDHHRKMIGHISNAVIFYHEPYASSTCEMVSELIQYFGDYGKITRIEAEALLAGIMLDTKNFIIKTGVRTFEAAAYLKKLGADTVEVKKLFSSPIETYQNRSALVSSAEIHNGCAIACADEVSSDIKIIVPQAADELLNIQGVDASFVMYDMNNEISISARSMGKINVQLIMEKLGGGGHLTMAGAQMKNISINDAKSKLIEAIDKYIAEKA